MGNRCGFSIIAVLTLILVFSFAYTQNRIDQTIDDLPVQKNLEQLLKDNNQTMSCSEYRKEEVARFELTCSYKEIMDYNYQDGPGYMDIVYGLYLFYLKLTDLSNYKALAQYLS